LDALDDLDIQHSDSWQVQRTAAAHGEWVAAVQVDNLRA